MIHRIGRRYLSGMTFVIAIATASACGNEKERGATPADSVRTPPPIDSASGARSAVLDSLVEMPRTAAGVAGKGDSLPKILGEYAHAAEEFRAYAMTLGFRGQPRLRKCRDSTKCDGKPKAQLWIGATRGAHEVSVKDMPLTGYIMGMISNQGQFEDSTTEIPGTPPHTTAAEYYIVVWKSPIQSADMSLAIVSYDAQGKMNPDLEIHDLPKPLKPCNHAKKPKAEADFRDCSWTPVIGNTNDSLNAAKRKFTSTDVATPWFSCSEGCCTAEFPPLTALRAAAAKRMTKGA